MSKTKEGLLFSATLLPSGSSGLIPGSITQALIDPWNQRRLINHGANVRKQNSFQTIIMVKAEGNGQGRDLSLKLLPPPVFLTEQGQHIASHRKFNHDGWRQRAQVTQEKEQPIIHRSYSIVWPGFGTLAQRCSISNVKNAASREPISHESGRLYFQYLPALKH